MGNRALLDLLRRDYVNDADEVLDYKIVRKFFDISKKGEYTLDDQTWDDLNMNKVYEKLNRTYSSLGEEVLYSMLRNPLMDGAKLEERDKLIELFKSNSNLREKLQGNFFKLRKNRQNSFLEMIENNLVVNKTKYYVYTFLGKILPLIVIFLALYADIKYIVLLMAVSGLNSYISSKEVKEMKANGISYLRDIIKAAKKITNVKNKEIIYYTDKIASILKKIKAIERGTRFLDFENMWGGFFEQLSGVLMLQESSYYAISDLINKNKEILLELYYTIGELEALIAISGYQHNLKENYVKPKFLKEVSLGIREGVHPLINNAVPNSILIKNHGIVLTGTNTSGKSTFLRMLGVNILLAQTFYFVLAKEYEACFFNIVSSISPNDDLINGKSFYMAEAESILRIIKALEKEAPVFCPIDEIFRGTNPIERISMSAEILTYLNKGKTISIVATHDRELVEILKESYEFYYFSENIDSSNGLDFDYKLKKGVSQTRNAIKLLQYMCYPQIIIDNSYKRAESIEGFI